MSTLKRVLPLLAIGLIGLKVPVNAQIAAFHFTAGVGPVTGWTDLNGNAADSVITGTAGGITISSVAAANWSPFAGTCAIDGYGAYPGVYFPVGVMSNSWYQYNGTSRNLAEYNALMPQLELTGLNPDSTYILRMSGSNGSGLNNNPTVYTVAGTTVYASQNLNTGGNTTQGITFTAIRPDATGMIRIYINCTSSTDLAVIGGIQIFWGSALVNTPTVAITTPGNGTIFAEGGNLAIQATASEPGESIVKVEFYADTTKIGEVDAAPYNFTWVDPDPGSYQLTAKATDNIGTINSASINIDVTSLNYFWSTTGNIATGGDSSFLGTVDSNRLAFRTKNIERMSILPTGNIGIGTITPSAQFHTTGSVRLAGLTSDSTKTRVLVSDTSGNLFYRSALSISGHWQYLNGVVYDSADAIAIGTSNPQGYKLAVNGTAIFTKVKVKTAGTWPDYVFKKGYSLPDLKQLETYLVKYRHLPGIASEAEVQRDGLDLGDHQAALLKKVEELTLYVIDQNKALTQQNQQLSEQKARLDQQQQEIEALKKLIGEKK